MKISLKVPDMTCNHCKMTIENAVNALGTVDTVEVDLDTKIVDVAGSAGVDKVVSAIRDSGYTVEQILSVK